MMTSNAINDKHACYFEFSLASVSLGILLALFMSTSLRAAEQKQLLWGDTHLHTSYSVDAFFLGNQIAGPDTAYRWAKGQPVIHPYHKGRIQLSRPLDFLVVSDHAELLGVPRSLMNQDPVLNATEVGKRYLQLVKAGRGREVFDAMIGGENAEEGLILHNEAVLKKNWREITETADRHNLPGEFTALIGWEWSSMIEGANLHRIVITSGDAEASKKYLPYSTVESVDVEDLWAWLTETRKNTGADFVSIPHNSNVSNTMMFDTVDLQDNKIDADYARRRMEWETIVEVTQIKGDSETHPALSPDDEFANFEYFPAFLAPTLSAKAPPTHTAGDYVRGALKRGLEISSELGINPYQFGMIGSTDAHTALASADEDYFWGKTARDSVPEKKQDDAIVGVDGWSMSASGLAAVWAKDNSRDAILAALRAREVYASTGPRMSVRLFGGWNFKPKHARDTDFADIGYARGVPIGGILRADGKSKVPGFLVAATREADGANLDRIQIVKGWVDANGTSHEHVFDVAWSDDREPDRQGKLPAVGNTVNLDTGRVSNTIGSAQLVTFWQDPAFDPTQAAFYYARVLQIPTARHSLLDALALGIPVEETNQVATIQERAYTSPIWYQPK